MSIVLAASLLSPQGVRLVLGIYLIIFTLYWIAAILYDVFKSGYKPATKVASGIASPSFILLFLLLIAMLLVLPASILTIRVLPYSRALAAVGLIVGLVGILFAIWARRHLGSNWSGIVMLKKNHKLVTSGPYAIVRHPIYTGIFVWIFGSWLALGDIWGTTALIGTLIVCLLRIRTEEKIMLEGFGKQYRDYQKRTKRFIPLVW